jgi:hypothetical protein
MTEEIKFEIGEKYENMKGAFEVLAIRQGFHGYSMGRRRGNIDIH